MVMVCPVWELDEYAQYCVDKYKTDTEYRAKFRGQADFIQKMKNLIKDVYNHKRLGFHLLKECTIPECETEPLLVDFGNMYSLPLDYIKKFAATDINNRQRLRLLTDYRVDLMARFHYMFTRGALPEGYDIKDVTINIDPKQLESDIIEKDLGLEDAEIKPNVKDVDTTTYHA